MEEKEIKEETKENKIKQAFSKVKEDIFNLSNEINNLNQAIYQIIQQLPLEITELKQSVSEIKQDIELIKKIMKTTIKQEIPIKTQVKTPTETPTHKPTIPTETRGYPTHFPTNQHTPQPLIKQNLAISTGNQGVPTDKPTDKPTDTQHINTNFINNKPDRLEVEKILASLDNLKKDLRLKFKRLTKQEFLVFSTLYSFENIDVDYKLLADRLKLSESSIRDYISRIIEKGIPIKKEKINNKQILLSISPELKKLASLETIMQLRGL